MQQCAALRQVAEARSREAREGLERACGELRQLCGELRVQLEEGGGDAQQQQQAMGECGDGGIGVADAACTGRGGAGAGQLHSGDACACDKKGCAVVLAVAAADAADAAGHLSTAAVGARLERLEALGRELQRLAELHAAPLDQGTSTAPQEAAGDLPEPSLHSPPPSPGPGQGPGLGVCKEPPTLFTTSHASSSHRSPSRATSPNLSPRPSTSPSPSPGADALGLVYTLSPRNSSQLLLQQQHSATSPRGGTQPGSRPLSMHDLQGARAPPNVQHLYPQDPAQDQGYPSASPALLLLAATAAAAAAPRPKRVGDGVPWETEGAPGGPRADAGAGTGAGRGARVGGRARGQEGLAGGAGKAAGEGSKDVAAAPALLPLSAGSGSQAVKGSAAHAASAAAVASAPLLPSGPSRSSGSSGSSGDSGALGRLASLSTGPPTPGTPDPRPAAGPQDPLPPLPQPLSPGPSDALPLHVQQGLAPAGQESRKAGGSGGGVAASLAGAVAVAANTPAAPKALADHPVLLQLANEALRRQVAELQRQNDLLQLQLLGTGMGKGPGPGVGAGTGSASGAGTGAGGAGAGTGTGPSGGLGGAPGAGAGGAPLLAGGRVGLQGPGKPPAHPTGAAAGGRKEADEAGSGGTKVAGPKAAAAVAGLDAVAATGVKGALGGAASGGGGGGDASGAAAVRAVPVLGSGGAPRDPESCSASAAQAAASAPVSAPHPQAQSRAERARGAGESGGHPPAVVGSNAPLGHGPPSAKEQKDRQAAQRCHWGILAHTAAPQHLDPFCTAYFGSLPPGAVQASHQHQRQHHHYPLSSSPGSRQGLFGSLGGTSPGGVSGVSQRGSAGGSCGGAAQRGPAPSHRRTASAEHLNMPALPPAWQLEQQHHHQQQQQHHHQQLTSCPGTGTPSAEAEGSIGRQEGAPGAVVADAVLAGAVGRNASWSCGQRAAAPGRAGAAATSRGGPAGPGSATEGHTIALSGSSGPTPPAVAAAATALVVAEPLVCSPVAGGARGSNHGNPAGSPLALLSPPVSAGSPVCAAGARGGSNGGGAVGEAAAGAAGGVAAAAAGAVLGTCGHLPSVVAPESSQSAASPMALWEGSGAAGPAAVVATAAEAAEAAHPPLVVPTGVQERGQGRQGKQQQQQQQQLVPPPGVDPGLWELELLVSSSRKR